MSTYKHFDIILSAKVNSGKSNWQAYELINLNLRNELYNARINFKILNIRISFLS